MFTFKIGLFCLKPKILPRSTSVRNPFPVEFKAQYQIDHEPWDKILFDFLQLHSLPHPLLSHLTSQQFLQINIK